MPKTKPKCLPIPADVREKLSDASTSKIDKIQLAEQIREQYRQSRAEMIRLTGIGNSEYARGQKILRSNNTEVLERLRGGDSNFREAINMLSTPDYGRYRLRSSVQNVETVLYENTCTLLYQQDDKAYLRISFKNRGKTSWHVHEKVYLLDSEPYGVGTVLKLLESGYTIHFDLCVTKEKKSFGSLRHHIIAAYAQIPLADAIKEKVYTRYLHGWTNRDDIRIQNLRCDAIPILNKNFSVSRNREDLVIICRPNGNVYYTDYERVLYDLLNDNQTKLRCRGRDKRLSVLLPNGQYEYIYHLIVAASLYGYPETKDDFVRIMEKFRSDYIAVGKEVDHLDGDVANNRTENLVLMDGADNKRKCALFQKIKLPYFCLWEKYDNASIKMHCGSYTATKKPTHFIDGVFSIKEALSELQRFVEHIHFEHIAMTESDLVHDKKKNWKD